MKIKSYINPALWTPAIGAKSIYLPELAQQIAKADKFGVSVRDHSLAETSTVETLPPYLKVESPYDQNSVIFAGRSGYDPAFAAWADKLLEGEGTDDGLKLTSDDDLAAFSNVDPETAALLAMLGGGSSAEEISMAALLSEVMGVGVDGDLGISDLMGMLGAMDLPGLGRMGPFATASVLTNRSDIRIDADFSRLPILPWHDDQFLAFLDGLPHNIFNLFMFQLLTTWNSLCGALMNLSIADRWHEVEVKSGVSRSDVEQIMPRILESFVKWGQAYREKNGNILGAREAMRLTVSNMRYLMPAMTVFASEVNVTPLLASPSGSIKSKVVSDVGKRPGHVLIAMDDVATYPKRLAWISRLEFIRAQLREFPEISVVVSVDAGATQRLLELLQKHLEQTEMDRVSFLVLPFHDPKYKSDSRVSWARDGFLLFEDIDGGDLVLKAPDVNIQSAPHVLRAFGELIGARPELLPANGFEGGNHHPADDVVIVGIGELAKNGPYPAFDPEALQRVINNYADAMGKDVLFVGDPIIGQAIPHIDLYITQLPDKTVMVSDFKTGLQHLKDLTDDQWDSLLEQHRADVARWVPVLSVHEKEIDILESLAACFRPSTRDEALLQTIENWAKGMSVTIDHEIELIEATGRKVARMPGYLIPGIGRGMGYANVVIEREDDGNVMFVPSYGRELDEGAVKAFKAAGYQGRIVLVPGMMISALLCGGTARCISFIAPKSEKSQDSHSWMFDHKVLLKLFRAVDNEEAKVSVSNNQRIFESLSADGKEVVMQALEIDIQKRVQNGQVRPYQMNEDGQKLIALALHAHYLALRHARLNSRHHLIDSREYWQEVVRFVRENESFVTDRMARKEIVLSLAGMIQSKTAQNQFRSEFVAKLFDYNGDADVSVHQGVFIVTIVKDGLEWVTAFPPQEEIWFSSRSLRRERYSDTFDRHVELVMSNVNDSLQDPFVQRKVQMNFKNWYRGVGREFTRKRADEPFVE